MKKILKKRFLILSIMGSLLFQLTAETKTNEYGLATDLKNGAIFHAWCWSFDTIKKNMSEIAAAGFSAVQTSPISRCLVGEDGGLEIFGHGKWYYHYQPTKYVIGNYQMGSEKSFISMCEEAHKYGIKVIADTVINHCTATYSEIDPGLRNMEGGGFHPQDGYWSEVDRYEETQNALSGLWDLNTQNPKIQEHILAFLKKCVQDGADGFRFDAAKLIELPDDVSEKYKAKFTSDFWPIVLNNGATFQYGEVLQEGGKISYSSSMKSGYDDSLSSRLQAYHRYMNTTNSLYGFRIRDAAKNSNFNAAFISDNILPEGANIEKIVTWVESHDNFCNDASYKELDEQQVIRAWAVIASRKNGTPLFFDRPKGSTKNNPWGENKLGNAGSNMFKDSQVVEVNFFRNAMAGEEEYISNPTGKDSLAFIERGNKGLVIVNAAETDEKLDNVKISHLADGTYTDQVSKTQFTVSGGKISGTVEAGKVAVIYEKNIKGEKFLPEIESSVPSGYFLDDNLKTVISVRGCTSSTVKIGKEAERPVKNGETLVLGENLPFGKTIQITLTATTEDGKKISKKYSYKKVLYKKDTIVYFDTRAMGPNWNANRVCVYIYNDDATKTNASWPGEQMIEVGDGIYKYVLPYELESQLTHVIFNNGGGGAANQYPNGAGLDMYKGSKMILDANKSWKNYK